MTVVLTGVRSYNTAGRSYNLAGIAIKGATRVSGFPVELRDGSGHGGTAEYVFGIYLHPYNFALYHVHHLFLAVEECSCICTSF